MNFPVFFQIISIFLSHKPTVIVFFAGIFEYLLGKNRKLCYIMEYLCISNVNIRIFK